MPKKKPATPEDQSRKFVEEAQKLIDAGELNPTDAERRMDGAIKRLADERGPTSK